MKKDDERNLVALLAELSPGFLPYPVFIQIARLVVLSIIEFVPMRMNEGQVEVLLLSRGSADPIWPNELHTPGTVVRPTDTDDKRYLAFERITDEELAGTEIGSPHYVGSNLHKSRRGMEQAQVYWVEVLGEPKDGEFYSVDNLPFTLMESQRSFIVQAAKSFKTLKKS